MNSEANPGKHEEGMLISIKSSDEEERQRSKGDEEELPRSNGVEKELPMSKCENFCILLLVGVFIFLGLVIAVISCCCIFALCIMGILLLAVSYLVVRLLQLLTNGDAYNKATHLKNLIRLLIMECMLFFSVVLAIFYLLASTVSKIKHITLYDLSIRHWIQVAFMIIGLYTLSYFVSYVVKKRSPPMLWQYERGINAAQAASEIIDCLILWWSKALILKRVPPSFKQHHVMGLPTHIWIQGVIFILIGINTIAFCCHLITHLLHSCYKKTKGTLKVKSRKHIVMEELLFRKYAVYWADGLRKNIVFIFTSMLLFFSWNSYFMTHLVVKPEDKKVVRFVTMAFTSLLILALLWLIKSCILLSWKANQVYAQLRPRLLENREELYFLGILGRHKFDIFSIRGCSPLTKEPLDSTGGLNQISFKNNISDQKVAGDEGNEEKNHDLKRTQSKKTVPNNSNSDKLHWHLSQLVGFVWHPKLIMKVRDDLFIWKVKEDVQGDEQGKEQVGGSQKLCATLHDLQQMAQYFLRAQPTLSSDKYVPDMLHYLTTSAATSKRSLEEHLEQLIKSKTIHKVEGDSKNTSDSQREYEWNWFKQLVYKQSHRLSSNQINKNKSFKSLSLDISEPGTFTSTSNDVTCLSNETQQPHKIEKETLKAWLENARGTCMELANTLCSSEEVVNCMDNIMSGVLIGATFIMWLLLTGLATTKILVLIASPLLAATFIFGDTCKSLFQGFIFAYMCHPFNVGDLVVIENKMMEVKILGVWKTIFVEIGKSNEVIYPNSELANKKVINYKSDFDWNDCLEFTLKSFESDKIEPLRKAIKEDLSKDEKCSPNHISTEALASDEDVKVIVHLKYNTENQYGMTLYERLQEKHNLRSFFSIKIWNLLKHKTKKD